MSEKDAKDPGRCGCRIGTVINAVQTQAQKMRMAFFRPVLLGVFLVLAAVPLRAVVHRAALAPFTTDDNKWESIRTVADLDGLLQAELSGEPNIEWVEREQLNAVQKEIELSALSGATDSANALKRARWSKADWLVIGEFKVRDGKRELAIEVIDAAHADVLAATRLELSISAEEPLRDIPAKIRQIAEGIRAAFQEAGRREREVAGLPVVAVLLYPDLPDFQREFLATLENPKLMGCKVRVLRFPRAASAAGESALVQSGLAEDADGKWRSVADLYVWGSLVRQETGSIDGEQILDAHTPGVTITAWDGRSSPIQFVEEGEPVERRKFSGALADQAHRLAMSLGRVLRLPESVNAGDEEQRRRIGRALQRDAETLQEKRRYQESYLFDPAGRRHFFNVVQTLEAACFFDPFNRDAQEMLVRIRWNQNLEHDMKNRFRFLLGQSQAWGQFVERFGLAAPGPSIDEQIQLAMRESPVDHEKVARLMRKPTLDGMPVTVEYLMSSIRIAEVARLGDPEQFGYPEGVPENVTAQWIDDLTREVGKRTLATLDQKLSPSYYGLEVVFANRGQGHFYLRDAAVRSDLLNKIWPHLTEESKSSAAYRKNDDLYDGIRWTFAEVGKPGGEAQIFAGLPRPTPTPPKKQKPPFPPKPKPGEEPVAPSPPDAVGPVRLKPVKEDFEAPVSAGIYRIRDMAVLANDIWLIGEGQESAPVDSANSPLAESLRPTKYEATRLFRFRTSTKKLERVKETSTFTPLALATIGGQLWMTLGKDGIAQFDPSTGTLHRFGPEDGLNITSAYRLAALGDLVFATANLSDLFMWKSATKQWSRWNGDPRPSHHAELGGDLRRLCGLGESLFLYDGSASICDARTKAWSASVGGRDDFGIIQAVCAGHSGFWLGSDKGLFLVDRRTGAITDRIGMGGPIQGGIAALATDGDFLWIAAARKSGPSDILLYHVPSHQWVAQFVANRTISLAVDERYVWLGNGLSYGDGAKCLQRVEKRQFYEIPQSRWVANRP